MNITPEEARHIAELAHLEFDEAALQRMAAEMTKILGYIDQLKEVAAEGGGAPRGGAPPSSATPMREDETRPGVDRDAVERNAPAWRDGHFVVPKVIE